MTTQMTSCAFCRSRQLQWTNHSTEVCTVLAKHQCTYCKEFGHTNSRCPKSHLKKQRAEEFQKREEEKRARWEANEKVRKEEQEKHRKWSTWPRLAKEIAKSQKNINQQYKCTALARNIIRKT